MRRELKIWTLSVLLLGALLSGCGTTRASRPPAPVQIPVAESLRQGCLGMEAPSAVTMPPHADEAAAVGFLAAHALSPVNAATLAAMSAFARAVQTGERLYWGEREVTHAEIEATACIEKRQLIATIDASNAANAEAAE